jgi:predicted nucleic acid-binding protein
VKLSFVLDCSIAMAWCFADEATTHTKKLLERLASEVGITPAWWYLELTNVLALAEKKGRISPEDVVEFTELIESLNLELDNDGARRAFSPVLPLCRTYQLTSYDALYLELAIRRQLPLATLDEPLHKAARKAGVKLLGK